MQLPRLTVRRSSVHGRGAFARAEIAAGEVIAAYSGEVVDWPEANRRYQQRVAAHGHTFYFDLGDGRVIDGETGGNSTRWINHNCEPNCEAHVEDEQVVISALHDIAAGEELFLDYQLQVDLELEPEADNVYACRCGAPSCRSTMLAVGD